MKPNTCLQFNRGYSEKRNLDKHVTIHINLSDYSRCDDCVRGFRHVSDLETHLMMHTAQQTTEVHVVYSQRIHDTDVVEFSGHQIKIVHASGSENC